MTDTVVAGCSTVAWDSPSSTIATCVVDLDLGPVVLETRRWAGPFDRLWADSNERQWAS